MRFAFKNRLSAMMFEQQFAETIGSLVEAFVARAQPAPCIERCEVAYADARARISVGVADCPPKPASPTR